VNLGAVVAKAAAFVECKHRAPIVIVPGREGAAPIAWCDECGALKEGAVWAESKALRWVRSLRDMAETFGLL
jgi:hypothetical protein